MKLEDLINQELRENVDLDWVVYFEQVQKIATEEEIRLLFETGKNIHDKTNHFAKKYFQNSKIVLQRQTDPLNFKVFSETAEYLSRTNSLAFDMFLDGSVRIIDQGGTALADWAKCGQQFFTQDGFSVNAGQVYLMYTPDIICSGKILFSDWIKPAEEIYNQNSGALGDFIVYTSRIINRPDFPKIFEKYNSIGREFSNLGGLFFAASAFLEEQDKIKFEDVIEDACFFYKMHPSVASIFLRVSTWWLNEQPASCTYRQWADALKKVAGLNWEFAMFVIERSVWTVQIPQIADLEEILDKTREIAKFGEDAAKCLYISGEKYDKEAFDLVYTLGKQVIEKNVAAGDAYFQNVWMFVSQQLFGDIRDLIEKCAEPEDYDFLRYQFRWDEAKLNELGALRHLLEHKERPKPFFDYTHRAIPLRNPLRRLNAKEDPDWLNDGPGMHADLENYLRTRGLLTLRSLCFALLPLKFQRKDRARAIFGELMDKFGEYNCGGKSFRQHFIESVRDYDLFAGKSDDEIIQGLTEDAYPALKPLVEKIHKFEARDEELSDFLISLSAFFSDLAEFDSAKLRTPRHFADGLFDTKTLESCAFGPDGFAREACLQYLCDPNIQLLFLTTYLGDKPVANVGVAYLINTIDAKTREPVLVIDGVDGGPILESMCFDWQTAIYDAILSSSPHKVALNVNLDKKRYAPNAFLKYACDKMKVGYETRGKQTYVPASQRKCLVLRKQLLSESDPEAFRAIRTDKAYLEAWHKSNGEEYWNNGQGEVEVIELLDLRGAG